MRDCGNVMNVPLTLEEQGLGEFICKSLKVGQQGVDAGFLSQWKTLSARYAHGK